MQRIKLKTLFLTVCLTAICAVVLPLEASAQRRPRPSEPTFPIAVSGLPNERPVGDFEVVTAFFGSMPTGVTVSQEGRIFVCFPRGMADRPEFTAVEIVNGTAIPYPNRRLTRLNPLFPADTLVSVQSVVVDPRNRLWLLDNGMVGMDQLPGGPKLVGVDLATNRVFRTIRFPADVVLPTTSLNDIRFDLRRGADGVAFITDSSNQGTNAIITVDLATGASRRRLDRHPTTLAEPNFIGFVEGREYRTKMPGQPPGFITTGADGIAISADGSRLFYCPLASRRLFSVSTDALLNAGLSDAGVAATVRDEGMKPAADGLESDAEGRIYTTAYEENAVLRRNPDGTFETLLFDRRILWPDTLSLAEDGYLYLINNQLHRQPNFNNGVDIRQRPYSLLRVRVDDATPVRLR